MATGTPGTPGLSARLAVPIGRSSTASGSVGAGSVGLVANKSAVWKQHRQKGRKRSSVLVRFKKPYLATGLIFRAWLSMAYRDDYVVSTPFVKLVAVSGVT